MSHAIDFASNRFFFFKHNVDWRSYDDDENVRVISVSEGTTQPLEMAECIVKNIFRGSLSPEYAINLNRFNDFLSWPNAIHPKTLLLHFGIPDSTPELRHYLEILFMHLGDYPGDGDCLWAVGFIEYAKSSIPIAMSSGT